MTVATTRSKKRMTQQDLDEKVFGPEPEVSLVIGNRTLWLAKSLNWYSQSYDKKKAATFVLSWLKSQKYFDLTKIELSSISSNFNMFHPTFYGVMKLEEQGLDLEPKEIERLRNHVKSIANDSMGDVVSSIEEKKIVKAVSSRNPQQLLKEKVNGSVLADLEGMLDTWLFGKTLQERKEEYSLTDKIREYEIKGTVAINLIKEWLTTKINEFSIARESEGYELKPANVSRVLKNLKEFRDSLELIKIEVKNRKTRKPRQKKETPIDKVVGSVKYQQEAKEFSISSIAPEKILGKKVVYLFDTKYRALRVLQSDVGFTIKGTTIQDVDLDASFGIRLRKPLEILPIVLTKTELQIRKQLGRLSTKPAKTTGRLNENVVILRVM